MCTVADSQAAILCAALQQPLQVGEGAGARSGMGESGGGGAGVGMSLGQKWAGRQCRVLVISVASIIFVANVATLHSCLTEHDIIAWFQDIQVVRAADGSQSRWNAAWWESVPKEQVLFDNHSEWDVEQGLRSRPPSQCTACC